MRLSAIQCAKVLAQQRDEQDAQRRSSPFWASVGLAASIVLLLAGGLIAASGSSRYQVAHAAAHEGTMATGDAPSGEPMPVGNIPGWRQVFTDDFTKDVPLGSFPGAVAGKWSAYEDGWTDTSGNGTYYPSKVISIHNGVLNMYIHTENGVHMIAAPEPKIPGAVGSEGGLLYGRYAVRFRSDPIWGYKAAWLLWPDSEAWPGGGEIDFPEGSLDNTISAYMHRQNATSDTDQDAFSSLVSFASWHTAVTEWTPSSVTFSIDGQTIGTSTRGIPNTPMHWVLQTETATNGVTPNDTAAGNVQIDWVAVYVPAPTTSPLPAPTQPVYHSSPTATRASTHAPAQAPAVSPTKSATLVPRADPEASGANTFESLAVRTSIPTMVVAFLSSVVVYTRRVRKRAELHYPGSSRKNAPRRRT